MKAYTIAVLILLATMLTGCGSMSKIFNPYDDEFACPYSDPGMCTSVQKAYNASLNEEERTTTINGKVQGEQTPVCENGNCPQPAPVVVKREPAPKKIYEERKYETLAGLIQEEETPVMIPPQVVRVLILSYTGSENEMFGFRYAYFFATEPTWMPSTAVVR